MQQREADRRSWPLGRLLIACALATLALTTGAQAAGRWHFSRPGAIRGMRDGVGGLSCPSSSLCVAVSATDVLWSTDPLGGGSTWKKAPLPPALNLQALQGQSYTVDGISCPSRSFCVASDQAGNAYVTTDPTGGTGAWRETEVDFQGIVGLAAVSCASPTLCGALDITGYAYTTTTPSGRWPSAKISSHQQAIEYGISCNASASAALCAGVEGGRRVSITTDPAATPASWQTVTVSASVLSIACPSVSLCVAGGAGGRLFVSRSPTAAASWKSTKVPGTHTYDFTQLACHTASLCLATNEFGYAAVSTAPAARASAWRSQGRISGGSVTALSCPTSRICFVGTSTNREIVGRG